MQKGNEIPIEKNLKSTLMLTFIFCALSGRSKYKPDNLPRRHTSKPTCRCHVVDMSLFFEDARFVSKYSAGKGLNSTQFKPDNLSLN